MLECNAISSNKFIPCGKCEDGFIYVNGEEVKKCSCMRDYQRRKKLTHLLSKANIPLALSSDPKAVTLLDYDIDSSYVGEDKQGNIPKIKAFIEKFEERYSSLNLFLTGRHGTQKSVLSRVIGRDLLKQGKSVYYSLTDTLLKMILDAERDENLKKEVDRILKVDLLILDEISTDKTTIFKSGFQIPFLTSFLKRRLEVERKSTIFCSNSPIDNLGEGFGEAIQDLVSREVLDHSMIFCDNYKSKAVAFDVSTLWD